MTTAKIRLATKSQLQASIIIVILIPVVRGTSTVLNSTAIVALLAIFNLPHTGGAIAVLTLIMICRHLYLFLNRNYLGQSLLCE